MSITKAEFDFKFTGHGHYLVTHTSPKTGKIWTRTVTDMELIDSTKNEEEPTKVKLNELKRFVKLG